MSTHAFQDALLDGLGHVHDHLAAALVVLAGAAALLVALNFARLSALNLEAITYPSLVYYF